MSDDPFEFVGSKCGSRYGRTSRRCLLPMFHEPRDHEDRKGSWHPKPFHKLGDRTDEPAPTQEETPK